MKALVTGSNGFIGSFLVEALLQRNVEVCCLVRKTSNLRWIQHLPVEIAIGTLFDEDFLSSAIADVDLVFHLAGATKARNRADFFRSNTEATKNLLKVCLNKTSPPKFVFVSSLAAAGPSSTTTPLIETDTPRPITMYGESKWAAEKLVHDYMKQAPATIIRPPAVYGPRDSDILAFFRLIKRGVCLIPGYSINAVSIVHVDDLVQGIIKAGFSDKADSRTYFVCNDSDINWEHIGSVIARAMQKKIVTLHMPLIFTRITAIFSELWSRVNCKPALINFDKARDIRQPYWICSNQNIKKDLGFVQQVSLEEGTKQTVEWYTENKWL